MNSELIANSGSPDVADHPTVVGPHAGPIGIEDSRDPGIDPMAPAIRHGEGIGVSLGLVVHAPGSNWVDVTPVALGPRR
jgi:hypothetical protein